MFDIVVVHQKSLLIMRNSYRIYELSNFIDNTFIISENGHTNMYN